MNKYRVWMSATSTVNTTLEIEANSPALALEAARDFAQEHPNKIDWYYEGSGSIELDDEECWNADLIPPPPPTKTPTEKMRDFLGDAPFTVVTEKRLYRFFSGGKDVTYAIASFMGITLKMSAGIYKCDAIDMNPASVGSEVLQRLCEKIGRPVGSITVL